MNETTEAQHTQEIHAQKAPSYHIEVAQKAFAKESSNNPARREVLQDALERLTHTVVANTEIVHGTNGEAFPVTHVNITDFAKSLIRDPRYGNSEIPAARLDESDQEQQSLATRNIIEFNFTSAPTEQNGHPFTFIEEVMKQTMDRVPTLLKDLRDGKRPQEAVVYTLGTPTNRDWGVMPPEYAERLNGAPYETVGHSYANYVKSVMEKYPDKKHISVNFYGISMGAAYAGKTAQELLREGIVTQQQDKKRSIDLPSLYILMDSPVGFNTLDVDGKKLQTLFLKDVALNMFPWHFSPGKNHEGIFNPKVLLTPQLENQFLVWFDAQLRQRGIYRTGEQLGVPDEALKKQQHELKQVALKHLVDQMAEGVPLDPSMKVTIRRGTKDTLEKSNTYDTLGEHKSWREKAEARLKSKENIVSRRGLEKPLTSSLGASLIETSNPNIREGAVASGHVIPFFNSGEMRKWVKTVDTLLALQNGSFLDKAGRESVDMNKRIYPFAKVPDALFVLEKRGQDGLEPDVEVFQLDPQLRQLARLSLSALQRDHQEENKADKEYLGSHDLNQDYKFYDPDPKVIGYIRVSPSTMPESSDNGEYLMDFLTPNIIKADARTDQVNVYSQRLKLQTKNVITLPTIDQNRWLAGIKENGKYELLGSYKHLRDIFGDKFSDVLEQQGWSNFAEIHLIDADRFDHSFQTQEGSQPPASQS